MSQAANVFVSMQMTTLTYCIAPPQTRLPRYLENISKMSGKHKCMCLNARNIVNKKNELNIMVENIDPHIIGIIKSWASKDIADAKLRLTGCVMFRSNRKTGRGSYFIF